MQKLILAFQAFHLKIRVDVFMKHFYGIFLIAHLVDILWRKFAVAVVVVTPM